MTFNWESFEVTKNYYLKKELSQIIKKRNYGSIFYYGY
jgi:hypothetical protein